MLVLVKIQNMQHLGTRNEKIWHWQRRVTVMQNKCGGMHIRGWKVDLQPKENREDSNRYLNVTKIMFHAFWDL